MTEDDIKYRQGRSKEKVEGTEKIQTYTIIGGSILLALMFLFETFI